MFFFFYGALGKYVDEAECCVLGCFWGSLQRLLVAAVGLSCAAVGCSHSICGRPHFQKTPSMGKLQRCSSCSHVNVIILLRSHEILLRNSWESRYDTQKGQPFTSGGSDKDEICHHSTNPYLGQGHKSPWCWEQRLQGRVPSASVLKALTALWWRHVRVQPFLPM